MCTDYETLIHATTGILRKIDMRIVSSEITFNDGGKSHIISQPIQIRSLYVHLRYDRNSLLRFQNGSRRVSIKKKKGIENITMKKLICLHISIRTLFVNFFAKKKLIYKNILNGTVYKYIQQLEIIFT